MIPPLAANLQFFMADRVVYDGTGIGDTSAQTTARLAADTSRHDWVTVYWSGHNDIDEFISPAQIKQNIANAVASLTPGNTHFVIMSLVNEATPLGIKGGANYPVVLQLNADLAATYPNNFLDVRTPLVARYDPSNPQDVTDHANDVPPSSLRYDEIHLRQEGSSFVASLVRDFILARGW
jgi:lysophospholipase L1-like esterase